MKRLYSFIALFTLGSIMLLHSCKKDNDNLDSDVKISKIIGIEGGTIKMDEFASVTFTPGAFSEDTKVDLIRTERREIQEDFERAELLFGVDRANLHFIQVAAEALPKNDYTEVIVNISADVYQNLAQDYGFELFGLLEQGDGEDEIMLDFEPIPAVYDVATQTLRATVPQYFFSDATDGSMQTLTLAIGTTPGENLGQSPPSFQEDCAFYIGCPLDACSADNIKSPFGWRIHPITGVRTFHKGLDLLAPIGSKVYAVSDGTVEAVGYQFDQKKKTGWGYYVIISHKNQLGQSFRTLYAHLSAQKVQIKATVKEGDLIALSGNSGGVTAPHLHLEYITNRTSNIDAGRIDPWPLINSSAVRLKAAIGVMTGVNNCEHDWGVPGSGSSWEVKFDFTDPLNSVADGATLTFQDIEPVVNFPYTVPAGSLISQGGLVTSPTFCAKFGDPANNYFKVRVYLTLPNGSQSNCIYFNLKRPAGARSGEEKVEKGHPSSGRPS